MTSLLNLLLIRCAKVYGKYELGLGGLGIIVKSLSVHDVSLCLVFLFTYIKVALSSGTFKDEIR